MTTYTADDFKNARLATHPNGRIAARLIDGKPFCPSWILQAVGGVAHRSDHVMAQEGWVPVRECPDPEVHEGRGDDDRTIPWKTAALNWEYRAEKAEQERDELRAAAVELAPATPDPRPLTAREHLEAAWEAAHVPADGILPKGAEYVERYGDGSFYGPLTSGGGLRADHGVLERRLLDPPAPSRPEWEDAPYVWADSAQGEGRVIWKRSTSDDGRVIWSSSGTWHPSWMLTNPAPVAPEGVRVVTEEER